MWSASKYHVSHLVIERTYFSVSNSCINVHLSLLRGVLKCPQGPLSIHVHSPGMTEVNLLFVIYFQLLKCYPLLVMSIFQGSGGNFLIFLCFLVIFADCRDFVPASKVIGSVGKSAIFFHIDFRNCR